jgi:hypothetical protein
MTTTDLLNLEHRLRSEFVAHWDRINPGTSTGKHQYIGTTPSGLMVLRKVTFPNILRLTAWDAEQLVRNEEAAYLVAKEMGLDDLITPCISSRTTVAEFPSAVVNVSHQVWVNDADYIASVDVVDERDGIRALVFDLVTMNKDRHRKNILVRPDGKMLLIDHAVSFYKWTQFEWRYFLHKRFAGKDIPDDLLDGLDRVLAFLPDRVFELLDGGSAVAKMRQRAHVLRDAGKIVQVP